jgi:membrane-bound lytic murein transglycosylase F
MNADLKDTARQKLKDPASLLKLKKKIIEKGKNPVLLSARSNTHFNYQKWLQSDLALISKPYSRKISDYDKTIKKMARRYGFDWRLIAAQIYVESNFKNEAKSRVGAIGLMQVMPRTAKFMGYDPSSVISPEINISVGCMYNQRMYSLWGKQTKDYNRLAFALASYNAGRGRVLKSYSTKNNRTTWEHVYPLLPEETQLYVHKIYLKHDFYKKHLLP